jgi:hypothetical protein
MSTSIDASAVATTSAPTSRRSPVARLRSRDVNALLETVVLISLGTGLASWMIGTGWARWATVAHGMSGLTLLVLAPVKIRRSVQPGMRRRRWSRWLSVSFGVLVLLTVVTGLAHSTGLWFGVGLWSTLWIHVAAAFVLVPLFVWHVKSRPRSARRHDPERRALIGGAAACGVAAALYGAQEVAVRTLGSAGSRRRFTGSHERGSFSPDEMPTVSWLDDTAPDTRDDWALALGDRTVSIAELRSLATPVEATLDCTGGWWSTQRWDAVPLSSLVPGWSSRSVEITSATGYSRLFALSDATDLHLAVGYGGQPLRRGHGAPVRLIAPGRRGPWWVKWVSSVQPTERPAWLQLPFPHT